jgi:hypothetical protein
MNTYRIFVADPDSSGNHTHVVDGFGFFHAAERMRVIHNDHGRILAFELIKEGKINDQRFTNETKPSYSVR